MRRLEDPETRRLARESSLQEAEGYGGRGPDVECPRPVMPRLLETVMLARRMGWSRIGLVYCVGLESEAGTVCSLLEEAGLDVRSVMCKAGRVPKEHLGLREEEKIRPGSPEPMCNPLMQAETLNGAGTELNVVMGLCVGHDSLFLGASDAPCTVLATKDRVFGHNPLAAVYTLDSYSRWIRSVARGERER